jgi:hypothetical protein
MSVIALELVSNNGSDRFSGIMLDTIYLLYMLKTRNVFFLDWSILLHVAYWSSWRQSLRA